MHCCHKIQHDIIYLKNDHKFLVLTFGLFTKFYSEYNIVKFQIIAFGFYLHATQHDNLLGNKVV